jgi:GTP-binding protein
MKKLLKLAIVGRPNVGKSALFNRICKKRIAIVDEAEGITRDRLYAQSDFFGLPFEVIDTGGINARSKVAFNEQIRRQAEIAIEEADSLIMVVDSQVGITDLDYELAHILLRTKKPLCLAVNKMDDQRQDHLIYSFSPLGISNKVAVSAAQSWHIAELLEQALAPFKDDPAFFVDNPSQAINICIAGRTNVGKSSLVNYLLSEERCIVSPIPGTTRDSIDVPFTHDGTLFNLIDTAGIRRKKAENEVVDKFAFMRTERAIERADICLLMMDAQQGMTSQEKKMANKIEEAGKGCILLFNKWDLVKGFRMEHCLKGIEEDVGFLNHCPKLFMSAKTGRNVEKIFDYIKQVHENSQKRISTHELNKFIGACLQKNHPPMITGKRLRIYYMAQVQVQPPMFIVFVNYPHLMVESYKKYLYNQFRDTYSFSGVPIIMHLKGKPKMTKDERQEKAAVHKPLSHEDTASDSFEDNEDFDEDVFDAQNPHFID